VSHISSVNENGGPREKKGGKKNAKDKRKRMENPEGWDSEKKEKEKKGVVVGKGEKKQKKKKGNKALSIMMAKVA